MNRQVEVEDVAAKAAALGEVHAGIAPASSGLRRGGAHARVIGLAPPASGTI